MTASLAEDYEGVFETVGATVKFGDPHIIFCCQDIVNLARFVLELRHMGNSAFYKRPWQYVASWLAIFIIVYAWQIYRLGGIQDNILKILSDLLCTFPTLLILWAGFFAQFVLPVQKFNERQKIFDRLMAYIAGFHGPALFVRNGEIRGRPGETEKKGPGVIWLDTASAGVIRTAVEIKRAIGPGVHFLENGETITGTVDLHVQSQSLGPSEDDKPFDPKPAENADISEHNRYREVQNRRTMVSALTRDGIEIVPTISISFRVNTGFPEKEGQVGSRFGFRKGTAQKDIEYQELDKDAVYRAIIGEGINPNINHESPRYHVKWNQLPATLAVDVWREYVSKFTLNQLFEPIQLISDELAPSVQPSHNNTKLLGQPVQAAVKRDTIQGDLTTMLHEINLFMINVTDWLNDSNENKNTAKPQPVSPPGEAVNEQKMKTGFQIINDMVKARLTKTEVELLDEIGNRRNDKDHSREYKLLMGRGLKVLSVGISNPRLNPKVEEEIIKNWEAAWLAHAKAEKSQIDRRRSLVETDAQEQATIDYANYLSIAIEKDKPKGPKEFLKTLLRQSRLLIIRDDQLRSRMSSEQEEIEDIIKWIEENGS